MNKPLYSLEKIKFATDEATFEKAIHLYANNKVTEFKDNGFTYTAVVIGTQPYKAIVSNKYYDQGDCECYLGQNNTLCKHMVAVAVFALFRGRELTKEEKVQITNPIASEVLGELKVNELEQVKKKITVAISCIKYYRGPSKIWFAYQDSLTEGCNRLSVIFCKLPVSEQTGNLIVDTLLRLDRKLQSGVDDSDGTVGGFIQEAVEMLKEYVKLDPNVKNCFKKLLKIRSCFGWEESLVKMS